MNSHEDYARRAGRALRRKPRVGRVLKTWRVRFHTNRFDTTGFGVREMHVEAYDRAHALTIAAMATTNELWAPHVTRTTASVVPDSRFTFDPEVHGKV